MSATKPELYVAFDIEKMGPLFSQPIIAIGVAIGSSESTQILETYCFCFREEALAKAVELIDLEKSDKASAEEIERIKSEFLNRKDVDAATWNEFWVKNFEILKMIHESSYDPDDMWTRFRHLVDLIEVNYPNHEIVIVSDHPSFDVAQIDYQLESRFGRMPLRFTASGRYCCTADPSERMALGHPVSQEYEDFVEKEGRLTHWPMEDARGILRMMLEWKINVQPKFVQ